MTPNTSDSGYKIIVARSPFGSFDETKIEHWKPYVSLLKSRGVHIKNDEVISYLLAQLGAGLQWVIQQWGSSVPTGYRKPEIGFEDPATGPTKLQSMFSYFRDVNVIGVSTKILAISGADLNRTMAFRNAQNTNRPGEISFVGRSRDLFFLEGGVQEGDHSLWYQSRLGEDKAKFSYRGDTTNAEYYSQSHERHALEMEIQAAVDQSVPVETTAFLRKRMEEVMQG